MPGITFTFAPANDVPDHAAAEPTTAEQLPTGAGRG
jgi:hypothetical protein